MPLIRRDDVAALLSQWRSGELGAGGAMSAPQTGILLHNTGGDLSTGQEVVITGRMFDVTQQDAVNEYLTCGFQLSGRPPAEGDFGSGEPITASALEPIRSGACGRVALPGLTAALVTGESGGRVARGAGGFVRGQTGPWRVAASAGGFVFMVPDQEKKPDCVIVNQSGRDLTAGQILEVSPSLAQESAEEAKSAYETEGARLIGIEPTGHPAKYCVIVLADCPAGESAPCAAAGIVGAMVQIESKLDLTSVTEAAFLPLAGAEAGRFAAVSSRNGIFDRRNRLNSFDYGFGPVPLWRIIASSRRDAQNRVFAYLVPADRAPVPARIIGAVPIAANRWLYTIEELTIGLDPNTGLPYFDYRAGGKGWENRIGWAYNACEPTARIYPTRTREKVTAAVPYWDAEARLWMNDAQPRELTHTVRRAEGVVMVYGDHFQGHYFAQPNLPIIENVILTTDRHDVTTAAPELSAGDYIAFGDGGQASDADARAQGSGRKCEISWTGGSVGRSDWSRLIDGIQELVFDSAGFKVTIKDNRATISLR